MSSKIILASSSSRRKDFLTRLGIEFNAIPPLIDENPLQSETPRDFALRISAQKALSVANKLKHDCIVIGADTIVVAGGKMLGKPEDEKEAKSMLETLSDSEHSVITAFTIVRPEKELLHRESVETRVKFKKLAPDEIEGYIKTREPMDKAGAYGIQGIGAFMVEEVRGSYTNVVGMPLAEVVDSLRSLGVLKLFDE